MIESVEEFVALRTSDNPTDQSRAANEPADVGVWREVIAQHPEMRFWVAQNKTVPVEVLVDLLNDSDPRVRAMVARKRKLPSDVLEQLALDADDAVRLAVARHRNTPADVRRSLAENDPWVEVRHVAADHLE